MYQNKHFFRVIGIMSGTSLDGIDIALIKFNIKTWDFKILKSKLIPYNNYWTDELSDIHFKSKKQLLKIDQQARKTLLLGFICKGQCERGGFVVVFDLFAFRVFREKMKDAYQLLTVITTFFDFTHF